MFSNFTTEEIINLTKDKSFKYLFSKKEYIDDLLKSFYDYIKDEKVFEIANYDTQKHLIAQVKQQKEFFSDVYVHLDNGEYVGLEMYSGGFGMEEYVKSLSYLDRMFVNQFDVGDKFIDAKKVTLINFIKGNFSYENPCLVNRYSDCHKSTLKFVKNEFQEFILVRVDLVCTLEYNNSSSRFIKWCKFLNASSFAELKKLVEGDELMNNAYIDVKNYHDGFLSMNEYYNYVYELERFKDRGIEQGTKQKSFDVARTMLSEGESLEKIQKYSGLSLDEIKKLKYQMFD